MIYAIFRRKCSSCFYVHFEGQNTIVTGKKYNSHSIYIKIVSSWDHVFVSLCQCNPTKPADPIRPHFVNRFHPPNFGLHVIIGVSGGTYPTQIIAARVAAIHNIAVGLSVVHVWKPVVGAVDVGVGVGVVVVVVVVVLIVHLGE